MNWHSLFGTHDADPQLNRWDNGLFTSNCQICGRVMKPPAGKRQVARGGTSK